jgi:hypothetical protein
MDELFPQISSPHTLECRIPLSSTNYALGARSRRPYRALELLDLVDDGRKRHHHLVKQRIVGAHKLSGVHVLLARLETQTDHVRVGRPGLPNKRRTQEHTRAGR